jgi:membrane protease YdiL (CAAX protease family)
VRRIALFVSVTFAFSWMQWFAVIASQRGMIPFHVPLTAVAIFGPLAGALIVMRSRQERVAWLRSMVRWRVQPSIVVLACLLTPLLFVLSFASALLFVPAATAIRVPHLGTIATVLLGMFLTAGVGEEPGWRGFLLPELRKSMGAVAASSVVAMIWFAWHLPLFWVAGSSQADMPFVAFALGLAAYSFILTWLVEASSSSTFVAMLFHTVANATFWLAMVTLKGRPQERFFTATYILLLVVSAIAAAVSPWLCRNLRRGDFVPGCPRPQPR